MKTYKYAELSLKAQQRARRDYLDGWEETHEVGDMSDDEAHIALLNQDPQNNFTIDGEYIEEEH